MYTYILKLSDLNVLATLNIISRVNYYIRDRFIFLFYLTLDIAINY